MAVLNGEDPDVDVIQKKKKTKKTHKDELEDLRYDIEMVGFYKTKTQKYHVLFNFIEQNVVLT